MAFTLSLFFLSVEPTKLFKARSLLTNSLNCHTFVFPPCHPCYNLLQVEKKHALVFEPLPKNFQLFEEKV